MSRMSELSIEIQAMLEEGHQPRAIARYLEIPESRQRTRLGYGAQK